MRLEKFLTEKYYERIYDHEIFVNPTSSDIKDLKKAGVKIVRFLVDPNKKKVYVWDYSLLHVDVMERLPGVDEWDEKLIMKYIPGTGEIKGNKIKMYNSDEIEYRIENVQFEKSDLVKGWNWIWKKNLNWVNRYVDIKAWLKVWGKRFKNAMKKIED